MKKQWHKGLERLRIPLQQGWGAWLTCRLSGLENQVADMQNTWFMIPNEGIDEIKQWFLEVLGKALTSSKLPMYVQESYILGIFIVNTIWLLNRQKTCVNSFKTVPGRERVAQNLHKHFPKRKVWRIMAAAWGYVCCVLCRLCRGYVRAALGQGPCWGLALGGHLGP